MAYDSNMKAGNKALKAIRLAKPWSSGKMFRALHVAEGVLAAAMGVATWAKKRKDKKKRAKSKKSTEEKA